MKIYTSYSPEEIWQLYKDVGLVMRSGGNSKSPKLVKSTGVRPVDFKIIVGTDGKEYVWPDKTKGLSFATTIERLPNRSGKGGYIWAIPSRAKVPVDLVFNVADRDPTHIMLNVSRRMVMSEFIEKLQKLSTVMIRTNY